MEYCNGFPRDIFAAVKSSLFDRIDSIFARGRSFRVDARDDPAYPTHLKDDLEIV
jgi:chromosome condensin MukBEF MukE localization factor